MNNQIPFFMPPYNNFNNIPHDNSINPNNQYERILEKINNLEKSIRILENRLKKLESEYNNKNYSNEDPTDMYII